VYPIPLAPPVTRTTLSWKSFDIAVAVVKVLVIREGSALSWNCDHCEF